MPTYLCHRLYSRCERSFSSFGVGLFFKMFRKYFLKDFVYLTLFVIVSVKWDICLEWLFQRLSVAVKSAKEYMKLRGGCYLPVIYQLSFALTHLTSWRCHIELVLRFYSTKQKIFFFRKQSDEKISEVVENNIHNGPHYSKLHCS